MPATAPTGPKTIAPDNPPSAASATRSWANATDGVKVTAITTAARNRFMSGPLVVVESPVWSNQTDPGRTKYAAQSGARRICDFLFEFCVSGTYSTAPVSGSGTDDLRDCASVEIVVGPSAEGVWRMRWGQRRADHLPGISVSHLGKQCDCGGLLSVGFSTAPQGNRTRPHFRCGYHRSVLGNNRSRRQRTSSRYRPPS